MLPVVGDAAVKSSKYAIKIIKGRKLQKLFDLTDESLAAYGRIAKTLHQGEEITCRECLELSGKLLAHNPGKAAAIEKLASRITDSDKLKAVLNKVDEMGTTQKGKFLDDVGQIDDVAKFDGGLVEAWKVLSDYPVIRKGVTNLENLSNVVSKYSLSKSQVDELGEIIAKNGSKQKLLQHLDYATKYIDNPEDLFKLARIAPIKAIRSLPGTNGKIAIIGRKMDLVKIYKDELIAAGKQVEIFDGNIIPASARREMQEALESGKWLDETSEMYKANKEWAEKLVNEGYEIMDVGNPLRQGESIFYNLETKIIFGN
jgi:hypothetical protein